MSNEPVFRVRAKGKSESWFDPAYDRITVGFADRPSDEEVLLGRWEEPHGSGFAIKEIVLAYKDLPVLYRHLDQVLAGSIARLEAELARAEAEADEYKTALHQTNREVYMEIFTRRAAGSP